MYNPGALLLSWPTIKIQPDLFEVPYILKDTSVSCMIIVF